MKLYHFPTSPFVRKVMVLLHESDQLDDVEIVETVVGPLSPDSALMANNPLSKIPALERDDGPTLYDSRVVCAYLDDRARSGLYGDGERRWENLTLEATADGIMDAAILMVYEGRVRPEDKQWPDWVEAQWAKVERAISALNGRWMGHLSGKLSIGQIAVACALAYVDFRHGARDWRTANPELAQWFAAFETRESMELTRPPAG